MPSYLSCNSSSVSHLSLSLFIMLIIKKLVPETTYHRTPPSLALGSSSPNNSSNSKLDEHYIEHSNEKSRPSDPEALHRSTVPRPKSYSEELRVYNGVYPNKVSFVALLIRPFIACLTPVCLWAGLLYGVAITWLVLIATSVAQIFSAPRELGAPFCSFFLKI